MDDGVRHARIDGVKLLDFLLAADPAVVEVASMSACCLLCVVSAWAQGGKPRVPVPIIFDTDMGGDCDDVGALFILHGAVERG
ncbi:MAG: hypothetical protein ABI134_29445, partial [Byssovorax sp.]